MHIQLKSRLICTLNNTNTHAQQTHTTFTHAIITVTHLLRCQLAFQEEGLETGHQPHETSYDDSRFSMQNRCVL